MLNVLIVSCNVFWDQQWANIIIELCGGLITPIIIFLGFCFFRPRIKISDAIVHYEQPETMEKYYKIKVLNKTWMEITDVYFELYSIKKVGVNGGQNIVGVSLDVFPKKMLLINGSFYPSRKTQIDAEYAIHLRIKEDVDEILRVAHQSVVLKVYAKHSLTGLTRTFTKTYTSNHSIKKGNFNFGMNMEVSETKHTDDR